MTNMSFRSLRQIRDECALTLLGLHKKANAGHIGASLSCLEVLVDLAFSRASLEDKIILSKGHAASALYAVFSKSGRLNDADLSTYYQDGSRLAAHPPCSGVFPSIPFGTGSLGHGLSLATGLAFSQKFTKKTFQVYCILSDGDCNEGSTWEAAMFAAQHQLSHLTVIVDANGVQGFGSTKDVMNLEPLDEKWKSFGFQTQIVQDGNSFEDLAKAYQNFETHSSNKTQPKCIVARTTKGHGVSYMENKMEWHYLPMSDEQYQIAIKETSGKNA